MFTARTPKLAPDLSAPGHARVRLPVIQGVIRRRILATFGLEPLVMQAKFPARVRLKLHELRGIAGTCLIGLEAVRPRFVPKCLRLSSENAAHGIAVRRHIDRGEKEGVFIPRRDTGWAMTRLAGGRLFPGEHHRVLFRVREGSDRLELATQSDDGEVSVPSLLWAPVREADRSNWSAPSVSRTGAQSKRAIRPLLAEERERGASVASGITAREPSLILQDWWYTTLLGLNAPLRPPLKGHESADVAIVGGGMAGLSAALRLMESGRRVVLLERNVCGGSSTGKSAGFLTPDSELELSQLIRRFGVAAARDLWEVPLRGIELIVEQVHRHGISCDLLKQDSLFLGNGRAGWRAIEEEYRARRQLNYPQTLYAAAQLAGVLGSGGYSGGVRYPATYGINALLYAQGIKQVLLAHGVRIYESTEVHRIDGHALHTHLGSVTAASIIVCADKLKPSLTKYARNVFHAQTFLAISEPLEEDHIAQLFPDGPLQCWDTDLVYSYWRLTGDRRLLLGGGSALTTFALHAVTTPRVIENVIRRFKARFPYLQALEFIQYWPGLIDTTRDLFPTILRDEQAPWTHFVLGCVGLPWAAFCGDFAARHTIATADQDDHHYYRYFAEERSFLIPLGAERVLGKPLVFSLNNAWAKYHQVDPQ